MLLTLRNISKSYINANGDNGRKVLKGINMDIQSGSQIAITGPSGSGKSTLLNIAGGLDLPDDGEILYNERPINKLTQKELARFRNEEIGFVFQFHYLLPQFTILENILIPLIPFKRKETDFRPKAEMLMKKTGIWDIRNQKPGEVSGGECQRTAVVRALINSPKLLLADEPTGALDEDNGKSIADLLISFNKEENITLIVVTHSEELATKMDIRYRLKNGVLELNKKLNDHLQAGN